MTKATVFIALMRLLSATTVVAIVGLWLWALTDCLTNEQSSGDKVAWVVMLFVLNVAAALLYLLFRRPSRIAKYGH